MNPGPDLIEKRTCTQCRKSKVKCDKSNPCARCIRLGLSCVEQVRGRGRPLVSYMVRPSDMMDQRDVLQTYDSGQGQWNFFSVNQVEAAQPVIQDFFKDEGRLKLINRRKLLIVLRSWGLTARSKKTQAFLKTVQTVASTFHLELKDILNMEPEVYRELCGGDERKTWAFNPLEMPEFINALDCEASAVSKRIVIDGESRYYNNDMFSSLFHSSEDADRMFERSTGYDVWLSCIDTEDRKEFYEACLSSMLLQPNMSSETCKVFKCKDKNSRTFLGVVRLRSMFFSAGDYVGYSFSITPIPNSKYFSPASAHPSGGVGSAVMGGTGVESLSSAARLRAFVDLKAPLTLPSHPPRSILDPPAPPLGPPGSSAYPFHSQVPPPPPAHHHRPQYQPAGLGMPTGSSGSGSNAPIHQDELRGWSAAPAVNHASAAPPQHMGGYGGLPPTGGIGGPTTGMGGVAMAPPSNGSLGMQHQQQQQQLPPQMGHKRSRVDGDSLDTEAERTIAATLQRMSKPQGQGVPSGIGSMLTSGVAPGLGSMMTSGQRSPPPPSASPPLSPSNAGSSVVTAPYPGSLSLLGGVASAAAPAPPSPPQQMAMGPQGASTLAQYLRSSAMSAVANTAAAAAAAAGNFGNAPSPQNRSMSPSEEAINFYNGGRPPSTAKVITQV